MVFWRFSSNGGLSVPSFCRLGQRSQLQHEGLECSEIWLVLKHELLNSSIESMVVAPYLRDVHRRRQELVDRAVDSNHKETPIKALVKVSFKHDREERTMRAGRVVVVWIVNERCHAQQGALHHPLTS